MYDFNTIVNRVNTGSAKWEEMKISNPNVSEGIIPFSLADMELKNPPEIIEGLKKYLDSAILGYTRPTKDYLIIRFEVAFMSFPQCLSGNPLMQQLIN